MPGLTGRSPFTQHYRPKEEDPMTINTVRETKATLSADSGRVIAWHNDKEKGSVSLAVPGDRARLTPAQARELGIWLIEASERVSTPEAKPFRTATARTPRPAPGYLTPPRW
ncbi:hypothetical protein ACFYXL_09515 [Streptomyces tsukubensis]|uniref:hypothetical protein n=1 Tax=Streptomyces tsukubensis TaxID=83656 RepID=UPI003687D003